MVDPVVQPDLVALLPVERPGLAALFVVDPVVRPDLVAQLFDDLVAQPVARPDLAAWRVADLGLVVQVLHSVACWVEAAADPLLKPRALYLCKLTTN